ncbi:MAG: hypothetical protein QOE68_2882 [Thermoanaerobaculia bacterium]|jgi:hypothetical protein|nr:hypothetical protein [Thermoanaerobaculia bacterium]
MDAYYYAGGRKIELERDDEHVAVDQQVAKRAGLDTRAADAGAAPQPAGGVVLTDRATFDKKTLAGLRKAGALQPVYKRERAVLVALPEVRIEFDNPDQRRAVLDVLSERGLLRHTISEDTDDWMVVRPTSGNGRDALTIANQVYEKAHPAAASVRFLQFVPKPGVTR